MAFLRMLAGFVIAVSMLTVMPVGAQQHGTASPTHPSTPGAAHPAIAPIGRGASGARPVSPRVLPPIAPVQFAGMHPPHVSLLAPTSTAPPAPSSFSLTDTLHTGPGTARRGFGFRNLTERPGPEFPYLFADGGAQPNCSPFLPGGFGDAWFDRQFTCFGVPFLGVDFYPQDFLAPQLAYEPWLEGLATGGQQQFAVTEETLVAQDLQIIAAIVTKQAAESNPNQQITMLVLKEGIAFGVVDYWVDNGKLGYVTTYGRQNTIDLSQLDMQKTVDLNSSRGVTFALREGTGPSSAPPAAPEAAPAPPAAPAPSR